MKRLIVIPYLIIGQSQLMIEFYIIETVRAKIFIDRRIVLEINYIIKVIYGFGIVA